MSRRDDDGRPRGFSLIPRGLPRDLGEVRSRVRALAERGARESVLVRKVAERADRILARLEGTSEVLDQAARLELRILQKLEPIVDDLGQLVRAQLALTLGRDPAGAVGAARSGRPAASRGGGDDDDIIDVTEDGHVGGDEGEKPTR